MSELVLFESETKNKIASLLLKGLEVKVVAKKCECLQETVYTVKNSAIYARLCYDSAMREMLTDGVQVAVRALIEVAKDKSAPKNARVSASDKLLQHTGYHITESGNLEKSASNMSQQELNQRLQSLMKEASERSKNTNIVEGTTNTPPPESLDDLIQ